MRTCCVPGGRIFSAFIYDFLTVKASPKKKMPPKKPAQVSINHNQTGYVCAKCRKPIPIDHMMAFQDKHYHPDCFICDGGCGKPLAGGAGFFEQPEGLFCKDCFANKKAPKDFVPCFALLSCYPLILQ